MSKKELLPVSGGDCFCCCYRNPPIVDHEEIMIGKFNNEAECAKICSSNDNYSRIHSCDSNPFACSPLNNQEVYEKIAFLRKKYNNNNLW